jgi:UMF1 family MFS transporter
MTEMYVLALYYGFLLGALQSFSRALFAELIPPGMESEFFGLYEITDRGSSWLGPVLVALCTDMLGRYAS